MDGTASSLLISNMVTHQEQQKIWEEEHKRPFVLPPMDSAEASGIVVNFFLWLKQHQQFDIFKGIEMGCGKGRNVIFLAKNGIQMTGFDFTESAIVEAKNRSQRQKLQHKTKFLVHDATIKWPFKNEIFDFAVDNFASTDIESLEGRKFARDEMTRVVKTGGYISVAALSDEDKLAKKNLLENLQEPHAYQYKQGGKFEKAFSEAEIEDFYKSLKLILKEKVKKTANFFGKDYPCLHWWIIYQKV